VTARPRPARRGWCVVTLSDRKATAMASGRRDDETARPCRIPAGMDDEAFAWVCQTCHQWVNEYRSSGSRPCDPPPPEHVPIERCEVWVRLLQPGDRIVEEPYVTGMVWLVVVDRPAAGGVS
jgi:hypothetical protein